MQNEPSYQPDYVWMSHLYQDSDNFVDTVHSVSGVAQKSIKNIMTFFFVSSDSPVSWQQLFLTFKLTCPITKTYAHKGCKIYFSVNNKSLEVVNKLVSRRCYQSGPLEVIGQ